jgi:HEAT repeat protein
MARTVLSPGVASQIAARLGAAHEEERRAELVKHSALLGHEMALAICDALSSTNDRSARRAFLDAMVVMGHDGRDAVERMLGDPRWFVVRNGVAILAEVGGDRAVELITSALAHPEAKVRREAILALAKVGGEDAGMLVYGMIEDPDGDVRRAAAMAAGALEYGRALKPLLALLDSEEDPDVLIGVMSALGQLGDPGAVNSLEKKAVSTFFSRPPTDVRIAAYRALHNIGTPHAKHLVVQAADDKDPGVRAVVRPLLGMR